MQGCLKQDGPGRIGGIQKFFGHMYCPVNFCHRSFPAFYQRDGLYADAYVPWILAENLHLFLCDGSGASRGDQNGFPAFIDIVRNIGRFLLDQIPVVGQLGSEGAGIYGNHVPLQLDAGLGDLFYIFQGDGVHYDHFASLLPLFLQGVPDGLLAV